jgi:hypothetical protein
MPTRGPRKDAPLRTNPQPMPTVVTSRPASAGPTMRAEVTSVEFRLTAFVSSSGGTSSLTSIRRAGLSKVFANPSTKARA